MWPMSPNALTASVSNAIVKMGGSSPSSQTDVDSPPTDPVTHNVQSVPQPVRFALLASPPVPEGPRLAHRPPGETPIAKQLWRHHTYSTVR